MRASTGDWRGLRSGAFWVICVAICVICFRQANTSEWIGSFPKEWTFGIADQVNTAMNWLVPKLSGPLHVVSTILGFLLNVTRGVLAWTPWPVAFCLFVIVAHRAGGLPLAVFTVVSLAYVAVTGYWERSMNTLALVGVAVPLSVVLGVQAGILCYRYKWLNSVMQPLLDVMQTLPAFAYLIPILLLFGFGPVVGLIASMIFSIPPMVRNTILGLQRVPPEISEAGLICGCNRRQLLWWVQIPAALPQMKIGMNQTTMAALSMVIIAAIIGGSDDVGWAVLNTMRKAQFGPSLIAGLVIALMAMLIDRISLNFAKTETAAPADARPGRWRHPHGLAALAVIVIILPPSLFIEQLHYYPREWVWDFTGQITTALDTFIASTSGALESLKRAGLFFFLLPLRIGLDQAVSPYSWGIEFTPALRIAYAGLIAAGSALALGSGSRTGAIFIAIWGVLFYYGTIGIPWPVFVCTIAMLAYAAGGAGTAALALATMIFILLNGLWEPAMFSAALCGAAILLAFPLGMAIGTVAAEVEWVSKAIRPVNDTLQTMPQFVYLIPFLMLFQVGEFTALIVVIAYALVPAIRYTEHGLRSVPVASVEAGRAAGCTEGQLLWWVKMPQAVPEIMLGLNQTVICALSMLVIAALVGTRGLGQQVYVALGKADSGLGLIAGLSIALVAITTDRILQGMSRSSKQALGL
ncbi:ABC transporter permease [Hoeflea alexandrii]|uniref:ABC transporter permease n=1 Tax=Hoeflea alexandrii TaxID=288436 RepID=UPI0022AED57A|nr:ABC transporter permease subunit [Hoeflea alexandrii]MCZ4291644.1 ABC transporter permease subunit [Hoeflea alexandrii]